ncbi:hypothetical protein, partial [Achromobacter sp. Marseille-Q0513]|uniref:hypothetical protein n=1 Tax=Achromobacter sp. Marseille-Q0513 TaxID=2829161 RepID=UPI0032C4A15B
MFFKILVLLAVAAGRVYLIKHPRRGQAAGAFHAAPARRKPAFVALCVGAALSLLASLMSAVLWMGAVAGGVTGGGYRGQADYLLPVAGRPLAPAAACGGGAGFPRPGRGAPPPAAPPPAPPPPPPAPPGRAAPAPPPRGAPPPR